MKIYRYAPFKSNPFGHGGEKRAQQITELLEGMDIHCESFSVNLICSNTKLERLITLPVNYKFIRSLNIPYISVKKYWTIANAIYYARQQIKHINPRSLIIYEHSLSLNWAIPPLLKQQGHKIIAMPHNLETLIVNQRSKFSNLPNLSGFLEEISVLKTAELVLTISKEEEWLLNLMGINAVYFPYVPSIKEYNELQKIANCRKDRKPNKTFLILGTICNPPTKLGMLELLSILNSPATNNLSFHIAGFDTEKLVFEEKFPDRFIFHGSVDIKSFINYMKMLTLQFYIRNLLLEH